MLAVPAKKWSWLAAVIVTAGVLGLTVWEYLDMRATSGDISAITALSGRFSAVEQHLARYELRRRIRTGEEDGIDALLTALKAADTDHVAAEDGLALAKAAEIKHVAAEDAIALADELLALGVNVNATGRPRGTALHGAILLNSPLAVIYLLEHCADPGLTMSFGRNENATEINAIELAYSMESMMDRIDYSAVIAALENQQTPAECLN